MMITEREPGDIVAEVLMTLSVDPESTFWLLEGVTDIKFFRPRLKNGLCLIDATGKYKLIRAMNIFNSEQKFSQANILGIVDNDYDWLVDYQPPENVISTEPRDLEGLMLRANSIACVLAEYARPALVENFVANGTSIIDAVIQRALFFGKIRAVNYTNNRVCLKKFKPIAFFRDDWSYDQESALARAVQLGVCETVEALIEEMQKLPLVNDWYYVRGHDAIDILCGGLKSVFGDGRPVGAAIIEPVLRQSLSDADFARSKIYTEVNSWHLSRGIDTPYKYQNL
ncbi:DUF4435 domain-containing protein [Pseudomonas sp. NMI1173_11]|uniref:DUF4435 domain-containing protein n=1 Tax=Pseudomonas sp. NMI1173_11 TaxID=2903145 RepID=UPI001E5A18F4|nr:DUF4435 domain-containing protein [Pseudomonas sp. NMI1173_11]MCE1004527.1 DUF4435 domain-containing protein [Pseudomonas sp. NMI1173_11]